jgi:hypothetical protein
MKTEKIEKAISVLVGELLYEKHACLMPEELMRQTVKNLNKLNTLYQLDEDLVINELYR